jgi:hypothetical protein
VTNASIAMTDANRAGRNHHRTDMGESLKRRLKALTGKLTRSMPGSCGDARGKVHEAYHRLKALSYCVSDPFFCFLGGARAACGVGCCQLMGRFSQFLAILKEKWLDY